MTRAIHRFGEERVGAVLRGLHDHVERLRNLDAKLVGGHGLHVLPTHLYDGHLEARDTHVEIRAATSIDEAQTHPFAGSEEPRPICGRRQPVHKEGVRRASDIGDVDWAHAHLAPLQPVGDRRAQSRAVDVFEKVADGAPLKVVVRRLLLDVVEDFVRILE